MMGILNGEAAYGVGFDGLDVWNIGDPDNPRPVNHVDVDTLATDATASVPGGALMVTRTDRFVHLDTSKTMAPTERASVPMPGSIDAYDAALVADTVLFLQQNYGLAIADAATLDVVGRYEFGLPSALQDRVFNDMHVDGTLAYLAAWGYGLFIVDVSNPRAPIELARQPFPFAHTVSVANGYAYVGKNTEGAEIGIMDGSNPEQPSLLARYSLPYNPAQLEARDGLLYIAAYSGSGAGLRIADVRNPSGASELGYYNEGCANAFGVVLAEAIPMAYVACSNGLHIVDTSNPARPKRIGYAPVEERGDPRISLAIRGGRAWYGSGAGVYEIDISHPRWPRHVGFTDIGGYGPVNMRAIGDNRVLALTGIAGIHVFEPAASDGATPLVNHRPVIGLSGDRGTELLYTIDVSSRARVLRFLTLGRRGDITLLVKRGAAPTTTDYDARSTRPGSHEATQIIRPQPGTWYVKIVGETKFDRVVLLGSYR
ncbi:MAG: pre-peptidase C-terminal domain-containing protein [Vicinamibacteraceae bacterium]